MLYSLFMRYEMYVAGIGFVGHVNTRKEARRIARECYNGAVFVLNRI